MNRLAVPILSGGTGGSGSVQGLMYFSLPLGRGTSIGAEVPHRTGSSSKPGPVTVTDNSYVKDVCSIYLSEKISQTMFLKFSRDIVNTSRRLPITQTSVME